MRLSPSQQRVIPQILRRHFGDQAEIRLFGSRADDDARGGDIDLYVETAISEPDVLIEAKLRALAELHRALGEQKIDLVVKHPGAEPQAIHRVAKATGLPL
jgi:predicted nucleotidyltransferase